MCVAPLSHNYCVRHTHTHTHTLFAPVSQAAVVPLALAGRDVCGSAITGSGKTAAFALPCLERLLHRPRQVRFVCVRACVCVGVWCVGYPIECACVFWGLVCGRARVCVWGGVRVQVRVGVWVWVWVWVCKCMCLGLREGFCVHNCRYLVSALQIAATYVLVLTPTRELAVRAHTLTTHPALLTLCLCVHVVVQIAATYVLVLTPTRELAVRVHSLTTHPALLTLCLCVHVVVQIAATYVLVLTPTRELAVQVHSMIANLAQHTDISAALVVGGLSSQVCVCVCVCVCVYVWWIGLCVWCVFVCVYVWWIGVCVCVVDWCVCVCVRVVEWCVCACVCGGSCK